MYSRASFLPNSLLINQMENKTDFLFKLYNKKATTSNGPFYEEPIGSYIPIDPKQIWIDHDLLPISKPPLSEFDGDVFYIVSLNGAVKPLLKRGIVELTQINGDVFYSPELIGFISPFFGDGSYHPQLTDATGAVIVHGAGGWAVDHASGVLKFWGGLPDGVQPPLTIEFYRYEGEKGLDDLLRTDGTNTMKPDYTPTLPKHVVTLDYFDNMVDLLKPNRPPGLSQVFRYSTGGFFAYNALTGALEECSLSPRPDVRPIIGFEVNAFDEFISWMVGTERFNESRVILADPPVVINGADLDSIVSLVDVFDPYEGEEQRAGFFLVAEAMFKPLKDLVRGLYIYHIEQKGKQCYQIEHSIFLEVMPVMYYTDLVIKPFLGELNYISGVPALGQGNSARIDLSLVNVIVEPNGHYQKDIGVLSGGVFVPKQITIGTPQVDKPYAVTSRLEVLSEVYTESATLTISLSNMDGSAVSSVVNVPQRIDTASDESRRVESGLGQFPVTFGSPFIPTRTLDRNEELQQLGGRFVFPSMDFTDRGGPDYSQLDPDQTRWVTQNLGRINGNSFVIKLEGLEGVEERTNNITTDIEIYAKVVGVSASYWVDCNSPFKGLGSPGSQVDGTGAMVSGRSSRSIKSCTFGTSARSGDLYVRVGFKQGVSFKGTARI